MKHTRRPKKEKVAEFAVSRSELDAAVRANLRAQLDLSFVILTILTAIAAFAHLIF